MYFSCSLHKYKSDRDIMYDGIVLYLLLHYKLFHSNSANIRYKVLSYLTNQLNLITTYLYRIWVEKYFLVL